MQTPRRILLIQLRAIGDVILTTPALRVLKRHFPDADIDFITTPAPAEILAGNPNLHEIILYPYRANDFAGFLKFCVKLYRNKYDISVDYLGTTATAVMSLASRAPRRVGYRLRFRRCFYTHHEQNYRGDVYNALTKFSLLKPLGISEEETDTEIFVTPEAAEWADQLFDLMGWKDEEVIALSPAAKRQARQWLPERFAEVARWLMSRGHRIVLTWGPGERDYVAGVARLIGSPDLLLPQTTLMQLAALLQRCRLLVCNCGGTKHIAVAVGTPTLTIHGPTDPRVWTPQGDARHAYVRAELDCLDCGKRECEPLKCMAAVSAEQVIQKILEMGVLA